MFATSSKKIATLAIAAVCAVSMSLAGGSAEAKLKGKDALLIGGAVLGSAILGGIIASNARPQYREVYADECWRERQIVGYKPSGRPIRRWVTVCE